MNNRYEALLILDAKGHEESVKDLIDRIEADFTKEGAHVESVQHIGKRQFTYVAHHLDAGHYVNFIFDGPPTVLKKLRTHFALDTDVIQQNYTRLPVKKRAAKKAATATEPA